MIGYPLNTLKTLTQLNV